MISLEGHSSYPAPDQAGMPVSGRAFTTSLID